MDTGHIDALSPQKRALLQQRLRGASASPSPAAARAGGPRIGPAPLSPAQEQLWYFSRLAPGNPVYNEAVSIRKDGPLDPDALRWALNTLVCRHEIWRTTFRSQNGEPVQIVESARPLDLPVIDLSRLPEAQREFTAVTAAAEQARKPYDLERGPLLRPLLFRFAADHHRLYLAMHHLIFDGVSLYRIILPEVVELYDAFASGRLPELPEPAVQYADYAIGLREHGRGSRHDERIAYWRRRLDGIPTLRLPADRPRPPGYRFHGAMQRFTISAPLAEELRRLSRGAGVTLFQVLASAFTVLLYRYSEQDDIVFGTVTDMRDRRELEPMVGYCLTPLVLRIDLADGPSFRALLGRVRNELVDALSNLVPFERLVRELAPPREPGVNPLFQVALVLEPSVAPVDPAWSLHQMEAEVSNAVGNAKFDLLLECDERPEGHIDGRLIFDSDLFDGRTAAQVARHWVAALEAVVAAPDVPVAELPLLDAHERHRQLVEFNDTTAAYPHDVCLHDLVSAQATRSPDAVAVAFGDQQLSYRELDERAGRLAHRLAAANPDRGLVALYLERSLDMVVGMLATLKSGAAYLPLDLGHPAQRLSVMLNDARPAVLLTERGLQFELPRSTAVVVCIDEPPGADLQSDIPLATASSDDLAYVLYTSGSTGGPKGVCITHRSVVNLLTSVAKEPGMTEQDTILAITTYAFDIAVIELWLPLITGARIVVASRDAAADGRQLISMLMVSDITIMQATPATWQMMIDAGWPGQPGLVAVSTGDALSPSLARALLDRTAVLWNMYGPTETTVWSTGVRVVPDAPVTIGRPIANTRIYILGRGRQPVPLGVAGELAIAGDGVGRGYLNRPELTRERFVADPFVEGEQMYLTGDLARQRPDGTIEHLGRLDHQIQIRGFRVEPGEIEAALTADPDIAHALVVAHGRELADVRLIAYVVPSGEAPSPTELRARLRTKLPAYMIPSRFVTLPVLPVSANGKLDRTALPEPQRDDVAHPTRFRAPRNGLEAEMAAIWSAILQVGHVGIDDDFFELGGHSLLALRLLVAVQNRLGVELPLDIFFEGPGATVATLAASVERGRHHDRADPADTHLPSDETAILFFVHPHESSLLTLRHFTRPLGSDYRLVGLLPERMAGRFDRSQSIEGLARPMLDTVRATQPHGPYYIAGYSLGGLLAYEIAGRLRQAGEQVAWLGVLDAATPSADARWLRHVFSLRQRALRQWRRGLRGSLVKLNEVVRRELTSRVARIGLRPAAATEEFDGLGAARLAVRYACVPHDAPMDLFVTDARVAGAGSESLGWAELHAGPLRIHHLGEDHVAIVTGHVDALAELVSTGVKEARRAVTGR